MFHDECGKKYSLVGCNEQQLLKCTEHLLKSELHLFRHVGQVKPYAHAQLSPGDPTPERAEVNCKGCRITVAVFVNTFVTGR